MRRVEFIKPELKINEEMLSKHNDIQKEIEVVEEERQEVIIN